MSRSVPPLVPAPTAGGLIAELAARFDAAHLHFGHGAAEALDEAAWLVLAVLGLPFDAPPGQLEQPVPAPELERIRELAARRIAQRVPLAYLLGEAWFAGLPLYADPRVMVPRSPLAEVLEDALQPWLDAARVRRVLDIGTGSGCLAIACALAFPAAMVDALDVDDGALEVARRNVRRHGLEARVRCLAGDLFPAPAAQQYDLIISNPPYVPEASFQALPPEYRHEPALALRAGADGLDVVRRMLGGARGQLRPDGVLVVEVGESRAALERAYPQLPFLWLDLERGGEGVFLLQAGQLP